MQPALIIQYSGKKTTRDLGGGRGDFRRTLLSLQVLISRGCQLIVVKPHTVGGDAWIKAEVKRWGVRSTRLVTVSEEVYGNITTIVGEVKRCIPEFGGPFLVCEGNLRLDPMSLITVQPRGDGWVVYKELVRVSELHVLRSRTSRLKKSDELYESHFMGLCGFRSLHIFEEAMLDLEAAGEEEATLLDVVNELRRAHRDIYIHGVPVLRPVGIHRAQSIEGSPQVFKDRLKSTG